MKCILFDTGPLISLAMNNLLWILKPLKERFGGTFYITDSVKKECVDKPMTSRKFKFEAIQVLKLIQDGVLTIYDNEKVKTDSLYLLENANSLFRVHDNYVRIVQFAEIETIMASKALNAEAVVIDEFITRTLIEKPMSARDRLNKRLHLDVETDKVNLNKFKEQVAGIRVIRSIELVIMAYELGFFKEYYLDMPNSKKTLLEGLLWGVKLNGCSISENEIEEVMKIEKF